MDEDEEGMKLNELKTCRQQRPRGAKSFVSCWNEDPRVFYRSKAYKSTLQYGELFKLDVANGHECLFQKDVLGHTGCVNSIEFNRTEEFLASGGDDTRVLLWRVSDLMCDEHPRPLATMQQQHLSNIFAHEFSTDSREVFSGGNDGVLLSHDIGTNTLLDRYEFDSSAIYNICANPSDTNLLAVAFESAKCGFYDRRTRGEFYMCIKRSSSIFFGERVQFYSGQYNPSHTSLFAIAAGQQGLLIYDLRNSKKPLMDSRFFSGLADDNTIYAGWAPNGNAVAALVSHKEPVYIDLVESRAVRLCDAEYINKHTIKSLQFLGDKQIVTGSDGFQLFLWDIPEADSDKLTTQGMLTMQTVHSATSILKGHRSIANHVRYGERSRLLVSCGVEKIIKCWNAFEMPGSYAKPRVRRMNEGGGENSSLFDRIGRHMQEETVEEDIRMLLYFDGLIHNEELQGPEMEMVSDDDSDDDRDRREVFVFRQADSSSDEEADNDAISVEIEGDSWNEDSSSESQTEDDEMSSGDRERKNERRQEEEDEVIAEIRKRRKALQRRLRAMLSRSEHNDGEESSSEHSSSSRDNGGGDRDQEEREQQEESTSGDEREPITSYPISSNHEP